MVAMPLAEEKAFLITIDTEGDSAWSRPRHIETRNAQALQRFQTLCERFGFRPTYLTNYEMALSPAMQELGHDVIRRRTGEVGMHLHAWNSPPLDPLTTDDLHHQPFLIEYPTPVLRQKVRFLTDLLEQTFATKMLSHRAGRWSFDARYASTLVECGYIVDCSVTPTVSWRDTPGDPAQHGGTDYRAFPQGAYFMDLEQIHRPGLSPLLELPMTIRGGRRHWARHLPVALERLPRVGAKLRQSRWLRPRRGNLREMQQLVNTAVADDSPYIEFMLHSSEFMAGVNPNFVDAPAIEALYADLEQLFETIAERFKGSTLAAYAQRVRAGEAPALGRYAS
ncbi:MAG: deacetylase [Burkholderiaceae bacterium]